MDIKPYIAYIVVLQKKKNYPDLKWRRKKSKTKMLKCLRSNYSRDLKIIEANALQKPGKIPFL